MTEGATKSAVCGALCNPFSNARPSTRAIQLSRDREGPARRDRAVAASHIYRLELRPLTSHVC